MDEGKREGGMYLRLDVENATSALFLYGANGGKRGTIKVAGKLCVLDEGVRVDELLEVVYGGKVVVGAIGLACAGCACRVWCIVSGKGSRGAKNGRETEKPNLSGNSAKRRFKRVLLPTPDGPDSTSGRRKL